MGAKIVTTVRVPTSDKVLVVPIVSFFVFYWDPSSCDKDKWRVLNCLWRSYWFHCLIQTAVEMLVLVYLLIFLPAHLSDSSPARLLSASVASSPTCLKIIPLPIWLGRRRASNSQAQTWFSWNMIRRGRKHKYRHTHLALVQRIFMLPIWPVIRTSC